MTVKANDCQIVEQRDASEEKHQQRLMGVKERKTDKLQWGFSWNGSSQSHDLRHPAVTHKQRYLYLELDMNLHTVAKHRLPELIVAA
ncbi:hypothetical protein GWI33_007891 [Rhynchophorus ferrugineus]|uniref:Uncharacterized protein n=1 Tax=Rhynchophorus ferrugineus TaxID=354439 RepID=A0A834IFH8_RHYFE|nr:hypothetical protein GWI33_007891 [Rhynchophorus ferrugineus]